MINETSSSLGNSIKKIKFNNKFSNFSISLKKIIQTKNISNSKKTKKIHSFLILFIIIFIIIGIIIYHKIYKYNKNRIKINNVSNSVNNFSDRNNTAITTEKKDILNFDFENYENNIITDKMKKEAGWIMSQREANFINGIIRKIRPINCLEIGVASGGSSILILNAIKDIENSNLISLDLNKQLFLNQTKRTGHRVNEYFPELMKKWKLFTGDLPHKFLSKLNIKYDFLFIDTAHITPGEILNFIEALPFLNENSVIVIHDLLWQYFRKIEVKSKFYPASIILMPAIYGDKVLLGGQNEEVNNMGAVFLYPHQENHYLDYFLLLLNFWEYMPTDKQIKDLRAFIKNYYKKGLYLKMFDKAISENKKIINSSIEDINKLDSERLKILVNVIGRKNYTNYNKLI